MPVNSISYQPASAQLLAAYRPIVLKVAATATGGDPVPPFVVCDVYIEDVFYTSIMRTTPETDGLWHFDISDVLKKYLQPDIAQIDNSNILLASHSSAKVKCRFRSSDVDAEGFTVEEPTIPVQATRNTEAVAGTGFLSNEFWVVNAALQHEDNQNLATHLNAFKTGTWSEDAYPLSHRRSNHYFFCPGDSDHFPVIFKGDCLSADLKLHYKLRGQAVFTDLTAIDNNTCDTLDFTTEVNGNTVTVTMTDSIPADQSVIVQYKLQADSVWIDAGVFTVDEFDFTVGGADPAGDYDIRVIHFCNDCLSAEPAVGEFTLDESAVPLAWRGINPVCYLDGPTGTIYGVLEFRNTDTTEINAPNNISPTYRRTEETGDLWIKFYSDAAHLIPLSVTESNLNIYVKQRVETDRDAHPNDFINETLQTYTVSPSGVNEILLDTGVRINFLEQYYSTYPTISSQSDSEYIYTLFPTHRIPAANTGHVFYEDLEQYNTDTLVGTGVTKPNLEGDPDYIDPAVNTDYCPIGPPRVVAIYGTELQVAKLELTYGGNDYYFEPLNTEDLGDVLIMSVPRFTPVTISVKTKTLDSANLTGQMKVSVIWYDGTYHTDDFSVPNNVETTLPGLFQNISSIAISNY